MSGVEAAEEWECVPGYEGVYDISSRGAVRSLHWAHPRLLHPARKANGYFYVTLARSGEKHKEYVHRLVALVFLPRPLDDSFVVCHYDGNPENNRVENLRWDSESSNQYDKVRHGRHPAATKTHCKWGHLLAEPNLVPSMTKRGFRNCLACQRAQSKAFHNPNIDRRATADEIFKTIMNDGAIT